MKTKELVKFIIPVTITAVAVGLVIFSLGVVNKVKETDRKLGAMRAERISKTQQAGADKLLSKFPRAISAKPKKISVLKTPITRMASYDHADYFDNDESDDLYGEIWTAIFDNLRSGRHLVPVQYLDIPTSEVDYIPSNYIYNTCGGNVECLKDLYTSLICEYVSRWTYDRIVRFDRVNIGGLEVSMSIFYSDICGNYVLIYLGPDLDREYGITAEELRLLLNENDYRIDNVGPISESELIGNHILGCRDRSAFWAWEQIREEGPPREHHTYYQLSLHEGNYNVGLVDWREGSGSPSHYAHISNVYPDNICGMMIRMHAPLVIPER